MELIYNPSRDKIKKAANALKKGHLVAFPTETVYGLGADAVNEKAVSRVYSVKGRPTDHPLIVHISSIRQLDNWAVHIPEFAIKLASEFWPGPMTLVLRRSPLAKDFITGGQNTIGLRVPNQFLALALINEFEKLGGLGIAAPSANKFGAVSPTNIEAVKEELGNLLQTEDLILGGGQSTVGVESTIIDCTRAYPNVLRPGAITFEMIEKITGHINTLDLNQMKVRVPGLLNSHYSPKAQVVVGQNAAPGEGFIAFAYVPTPRGAIRLASPENIEQFAYDLYSALRRADTLGIRKIVVVQPEGNGLAIAIRDRVNKASKT
jgi:L-threonylcarbamoyladenylate synthase